MTGREGCRRTSNAPAHRARRNRLRPRSQSLLPCLHSFRRPSSLTAGCWQYLAITPVTDCDPDPRRRVWDHPRTTRFFERKYQSGYSGKVLGPKQVKKFGKQSLGSTVGGLGCYFALVDDPEQSEKLRIVADALSTVSAATKSACPPRQPRASPAGNSSK